MIGVDCSSYTLDMRWIWSLGEVHQRLMNIQTLKCAERHNLVFNSPVIMQPCWFNYDSYQSMICKKNNDNERINISWEYKDSQVMLMHLNRKYKAVTRLTNHEWSGRETKPCGSTTYAGKTLRFKLILIGIRSM